MGDIGFLCAFFCARALDWRLITLTLAVQKLAQLPQYFIIAFFWSY